MKVSYLTQLRHHRGFDKDAFCHHYCSCWLWMVYCVEPWNGKKRGLTWRLQESLEDMEYAHDVCLVSHEYEQMQRKLDDLWKESKKAGIEINSSKTEEIRVNTIVNQGLRLNGDDLPPTWPIGHVGGRSLLRYYDLYHRLQLQFYVLLMMGAVVTRNM